MLRSRPGPCKMATVDHPGASEGIRVEREGAWARVILDRPERHNALEAGDVAALNDALDGLATDPDLRVVVLTGAGEHTFCSGASLDQMRSGEMSGSIFDTLTDRLASLPVPTVARLNGSVYGGGAELALCCDFRVGVRASRLFVPAARLGVCYPLGGLRRYVQRLGVGVASRILLAAEELDAEEMWRTGFLTHLVDRDALDDTVSALADRLASLAPLAVRNMKRILLGVTRGDLEPSEVDRLVEECARSQDLREGLAAWRDGRAPDFEGR